MPHSLKTLLIPALKDNYIHLVYHAHTHEAVVIDPAEAAPVLNALNTHHLTLRYILNTHHHGDHVGGNEELKQKTSAHILGYEKDAARIPFMDQKLKDNQVITLLDQPIKIMTLLGHTLGHIAYFFKKQHWLYCGDVVFGMGCGRLFEGSYEQMFESLNKIKVLPRDTKIFCGHEYTEYNGKFALSVYPENKAIHERMKTVQALRAKNHATVPLLLSEELTTNPFLLAKDCEEFTRLRQLRNQF